jgi:hypothetical protein
LVSVYGFGTLAVNNGVWKEVTGEVTGVQEINSTGFTFTRPSGVREYLVSRPPVSSVKTRKKGQVPDKQNWRHCTLTIYPE